MAGLRLVSAFDVFRSLGSDPRVATAERTATWLRNEYLNRGGGQFNHDISIGCLARGFSGDMSEDQALHKCDTHWHGGARLQNRAVIKAVWPHVTAHPSVCYPRSFLAVPVGRVRDVTLYVGLKAPLVRVEHDSVFLVLPAFRRSFQPTDVQIDCLMGFAQLQTVREGYPDIQVECLHAGPGPNDTRYLRVLLGRERLMPPVGQLDAMLGTYVAAAALLINDGVGTEAADFRGYRVVDPDQPSMF